MIGDTVEQAARGRHPGRAGCRSTVSAVLAAVCSLVVAAALVALPAGGASAAEGPEVKVSRAEAGKGGTVTVSGQGWRPRALLTLLICGQNMIGGTNSCANGDGRAVTTGADGSFEKEIPVAEPPKPCPCVVHVATVTGEPDAADAAFKVAGHPVAPLPRPSEGGRLTVLAQAELRGSSGPLTWFGAPAQRQLVFTVGNLGSTPARNPVFEVGTSHGVFSPQWEEQQWRGTVPAGQKAQVKLPVELASGAHGDYLVSLKYGGKVLVEQPWGVGRPWGVTLFWILLCLVVPAAVFRIGMAIVDKIRPRDAAVGKAPRVATGAGSRMGEAGRHRAARFAERLPALRRTGSARESERRPENANGTAGAPRATDDSATLPWFTPDTAPSTTSNTDRPTSKGPM